MVEVGVEQWNGYNGLFLLYIIQYCKTGTDTCFYIMLFLLMLLV